MKIAYSNLACPEWTVEQAIDRAAEYGYQGLELRLLDGEVVDPKNLDSGRRKHIMDVARNAGVDIVGLGASTQLAVADTDTRRRHQKDLIGYLEMAAEMGIPMVRTFAGDGGTAEDSVRQMAESLNWVAEHAERLGVDVLLETHDYFSSSYLVRDALGQVKSPRIGALWDIFAPYSLGETVEETYSNLSSLMRHLHLKDGRRNGDTWRYVFLGEGEVPVQQILSKLQEVGYQGFISVEWERKWHPEIEPADVALPQYLSAYLRFMSDLA